MRSNSTTKAPALDTHERKRVLNILESNWQAEMRGVIRMNNGRSAKQSRNDASHFEILPKPKSTMPISG